MTKSHSFQQRKVWVFLFIKNNLSNKVQGYIFKFISTFMSMKRIHELFRHIYFQKKYFMWLMQVKFYFHSKYWSNKKICVFSNQGREGFLGAHWWEWPHAWTSVLLLYVSHLLPWSAVQIPAHSLCLWASDRWRVPVGTTQRVIW